MMKPSPTILIISYSLSGQTNGLLHGLVSGLEDSQCHVHHERLQPLAPIRFPFGSVPKTVVMMLRTFLRQRFAIAPLSTACDEQYNLIILAGPTWSYNPSGPMLFFIDRDGRRILKDQTVIPLISCRGYWRMHLWGLQRMLTQCGAEVANTMIFSHPAKEPWRTLGVFLKLSGKHPEKMAFIGSHYHRYGHDKTQAAEAREYGRLIGSHLAAGQPLADLALQHRTTCPD
ncbi:MAG: hypothetical protein KKD73_04445 [Proteobacteria bacterium]|nr:hypothetical protein [Pseudomonadota bacterium]MBU1639629.1 hypothetical protein [Pseudomonadota bacterium]